MFGLELPTFVFVAICTMAAILFGMICGFFIGRSYTLTHEPDQLRMDRERTLHALVELMKSTEELNTEVDEHNHELVSAKNDIAEMEFDDEIKILQSKLVDNISKVVQSNRKMENDLVVSRFQMEQQAQELDRTRREARSDGLCSDIGNRKAYDETIQFMISRLHSKKKKSFGLLLVDVDYFKRINDTFGHQSGDEVLISIGQALKECVRPEDVVCRIGGDEFAVLLDGLTPHNVAQVGARIRETIQIFDFSVGASGQSTVVTLSMGLTVGDLSDDVESLYQRADEALYKSKELGRNRLNVLLADGSSPQLINIQSVPDEPAEAPGENSYEAFKAALTEEVV